MFVVFLAKMSGQAKNEGQRNYEKFVDIYVKAYPHTHLGRQDAFSRAQNLWKEVKNDLDLHAATVADLKRRAAAEKSKPSNENKEKCRSYKQKGREQQATKSRIKNPPSLLKWPPLRQMRRIRYP